MPSDMYFPQALAVGLVFALWGPYAHILKWIGKGLHDSPDSPPESRMMVEETATVLTEAVRSINNGIRGFYYAIAALFLFAGPYYCMAATVAITTLLYYRQMFSPTAIAIGKYVDAL